MAGEMDSTPDGEAVYRSLSTAAVVSVVAGLASPLYFFGGVLIVFPLMAIGLAVAARQWVAAAPESRSGRGLASIGAALAVASIALVTTYQRVTPVLISQHCRVVADAWLDSVRRQDLERAGKLTRIPRPGPDQTEPATLMTVAPIVAELQTLRGWSGSAHAGCDEATELTPGVWLVRHRYLLSANGPGEDGPTEVVVSVAREPASRRGPQRVLVTEVTRPEGDG